MDLTPEFQRIVIPQEFLEQLKVRLNEVLSKPPLDRYSFKVEQVVNFNPRSRIQDSQLKSLEFEGTWASKWGPPEYKFSRWINEISDLLERRLKERGIKMLDFMVGDGEFEIAVELLTEQ